MACGFRCPGMLSRLFLILGRDVFVKGYRVVAKTISKGCPRAMSKPKDVAKGFSSKGCRHILTKGLWIIRGVQEILCFF